MSSLRFYGLDGSFAVVELGSPRSLETNIAPPKPVGDGSVWRVDHPAGGSVYRVFRGGFEVLDFSVEEGKPIVFSVGLEVEDRVYGFGEKYARLNRRYKRFNMWNVGQPHHLPYGDPTYASIPFYIIFSSRRSVGVLFDYAGYIGFDVDVERRSQVSASVDGGGVRVYLIWGGSLGEVVRALYRLVGGFPMPPKWALGYHQCRYSYMSQQEVLEVASKFREKRIPCDVLWLDLDYMDGYANFTWNRERFPEPAKMVDKLHAMGFRLVTIVEVGVPRGQGVAAYERLAEIDGFVKAHDGKPFMGVVWGGRPYVFPDFARRDVREKWAQLVGEWLAQGVDGIWLDMNEPSIAIMLNKANEAVKKLCSEEGGDEPGLRLMGLPRLSTQGLHKSERMVQIDAQHTLDSGETVDHSEIHNAYPLLEAWATREGFRALDGDRRWFILSRAGYTGIQRYAALWTGDNQADWGQLEISIPQLLSLSLCGVPFVGADVGGFFDDADPELLVRWTQLGAFYPFFRNHSYKFSNRREPWAFGEENEEKLRRAIELRYRFLPYIYQVFRQASSENQPIMRPLVYEFPGDEKTWDLDTEFMFGRSLLVAPVTQPGASVRSVYLPSGARWLDYWTRTEHSGGGWVQVEAPLDRIPIFVREDSVIPVCDPPYTDSSTWRPVVEAYVSDTARGILYDDDGLTQAYARGAYFEHEFVFERAGGTVKLSHRQLVAGYRPPYTQVGVRVLNDHIVEVVGLNRVFDLRSQELTIDL